MLSCRIVLRALVNFSHFSHHAGDLLASEALCNRILAKQEVSLERHPVRLVHIGCPRILAHTASSIHLCSREDHGTTAAIAVEMPARALNYTLLLRRP